LETIIEIAEVTCLVVVAPEVAVDDLKSNEHGLNPKVKAFDAIVAVIVWICL
jgi:hypothetical protein